MYNDHGLGIDNLDIGVSTSGAVEYFENLKTELLTNVEQKIDEIGPITTALDKGWQGVSRDRFDSQFEEAREALKMDLRREYKDLVVKINQAVEGYVNQDKNMIID